MNGKNHFVHNVIAGSAIVGAAYLYEIPVEPVLIGSVLGTLFTPDIDQEGSSYTESIFRIVPYVALTAIGVNRGIANSVGKVFQAAIQTLFAPIAFLFPHRDFLTHLPPFSVLVKCAWLYCLYYLYAKVFDQQPTPYTSFLYSTYYQTIFAAWCIQDAVHTFIGDGGMVLFFGKKVYLLSWLWYKAMHKLFNTDK